MGHLADEFIIGERLGFMLKQKAMVFESKIIMVSGDRIYFVGRLDGQLPLGFSEWPIIAYDPDTVLDYVKKKYEGEHYNRLIEVSTDATLHPSKSIIEVQTI